MASVADAEARALVETAQDLGMDVLVEVHDERELERALPLDASSSASTTATCAPSRPRSPCRERLAPLIPTDRIVVAESGIFAPCRTSNGCRAAGIRTFLVGESLMRQADVAEATRRLLFGEAAAAP